MKVSALVEYGFSPIALPCADREINGVYIGDLLSWVMGRANTDDAWITIMSNINVLAVASLADVSCVILAEGVTVEDEVIKAALDKQINILQCEQSSYEAAVTLSRLLG